MLCRSPEPSVFSVSCISLKSVSKSLLQNLASTLRYLLKSFPKEWLLYNTSAICHLPWYVLSMLVCLLYIFFSSIRVTCFFCTYSFFPMNQLNCVKIVNEQWDSNMSQISRPSRKKNMNQNRRRKLIQIFIHLMIADWNNFIAVNISLTKKYKPHWTAHRTYVSLTQILKDEKGVSED